MVISAWPVWIDQPNYGLDSLRQSVSINRSPDPRRVEAVPRARFPFDPAAGLVIGADRPALRGRD